MAENTAPAMRSTAARVVDVSAASCAIDSFLFIVSPP